MYQIDDILYIGSGLVDIRVTSDKKPYYIIIKKNAFESISDDDLDSLIISRINKNVVKDESSFYSKVTSIKANLNAKRG